MRYRSCTAMDTLVTEHMLTPPEALATLPAGERPCSRVCLAVAHQVFAPVEGLAALAARVRLLARRQGAQCRPRAARVRAAMAPQVLLAPECLAALGARVRLLTGVALPVAQQMRRLQGRLAALRARHGAWGRQEGREDGWQRSWRGTARLLLVRAHGPAVPRCGYLCPGGGPSSCRKRYTAVMAEAELVGSTVWGRKVAWRAGFPPLCLLARSFVQPNKHQRVADWTE